MSLESPARSLEPYLCLGRLTVAVNDLIGYKDDTSYGRAFDEVTEGARRSLSAIR